MKLKSLFIVLLSIVIYPYSSHALTLKSHRAVYEFFLVDVGSGSSVTGVRGRIIHEWAKQCDGNVMNQKSLMIFQNEDGGAAASEDDTSIWESADGRRMRFYSHHKLNGKTETKLSGSAVLDASSVGRALFKEPKKQVMKLPGNVTFPNSFTELAIKQAQSGEKFFSRPMFDGTTEDGPLRAMVFFGKAHQKTPSYLKDQPLLQGRAGWPARVAYFKSKDQSGVPQVEIKLDIFDNGITGNMEFQYSDITIGAKLIQLESLPEPSC